MPHRNHWKTINSRTAYENPWMRIREDNVIQPDGNPGIYAYVEKCTAAGVIALDEERNVYLIGQYRYPLQCYSWEIIEGGVEPGEDPLAAAQRELEEEAGLQAADWRPLGGVLHLSNCISSEDARLYLATNLTETAAKPEATEVLERRKLPLRECIALVESGEITDAMSVIALLRLARELGL